MVALLIKSRYDAQRAVYEQPFSDGGQKIPFPQDFTVRILKVWFGALPRPMDPCRLRSRHSWTSQK